MTFRRAESIAVKTIGIVIALAIIAWLWLASYSLASLVTLKSTAIGRAFLGGDLLAPAKQAFVYFGDPRVKRLVAIATMGAFAEAVVLAGIVLALIFKPWEIKPPKDGSRLATRKDLESAGLTGGRPGFSILLGTYGSPPVDIRYCGDSHFFVNGPSRSGKGRGFVMTNLIEFRGSTVTLDVKLENWKLTAPARMALGQECFLFSPGSAGSHRWNPLDFVRPWPDRATDLSNLAASLIPIGEREEPHWKSTGRGLFAGILGYVLESKTMEGRRTLRSALRMFSTEKSISDVLLVILDTEPDLDSFITDAFRQHLARDPEQRPSFEGHITDALKPLNNRLIDAATSASDFDIRELRRKPFSLYIGAPVSDFGSVEPVIRLLVQQIHDIMLRDTPGPDEPYRVLFMLDEFYQFERLPEIIKRTPLASGYGLTIALIAQNIPQIDERYGVKTRDALLGNMDIQLYIGVGDDTTAKIASDNMGKHYVEREGWGPERGFSIGKRRSGGRFEAVPLMPADAVRRLDPKKTLLQVRSSYTAVLDKLNFYTDERFVTRRAEIAGRGKKLPEPVLEIAPEWPILAPKPENMVAATKAEPEAPVPAEPQAPPAITYAGTSFDDDMRDIELMARRVFRNTALLVQGAREALSALDNDEAAQVLNRLRLEPEHFGELLGAGTGLNFKLRLKRREAQALTGELRSLIFQARRRVNDERARLYTVAQIEANALRAAAASPVNGMKPKPTAEASGSVTPEAAISPETDKGDVLVPPPTASTEDGYFSDGERQEDFEEDEDTFTLEAATGFTRATEAIAECSGVAAKGRRAGNSKAIDSALTRISDEIGTIGDDLTAASFMGAQRNG